jgi:hypothetical protein
MELIYSFLCFVGYLPSDETPEMGAVEPGPYLKPNNSLKSCFGLNGN